MTTKKYSARITTKHLKCEGCALHLLAHLYNNLQKIHDSTDGKTYLIGRCPGCTTPFRQGLYEVEVVNRRFPPPQDDRDRVNISLSGVGSSVKLFAGSSTLDPMIRGNQDDEGEE